MSRLLIALLIGLAGACTPSSTTTPAWPPITRDHKPWTRWWWMGSSVNEDGLTASMEAYRDAGLGGLEITPIYGVAGYEDQFVDYLSADWMALLAHTLHEAERLDLGVDMATGTGWPFGGPWVGADEASRYVAYKTYAVEGGARLREPVRYRQEPLVRAVGNQIYELHGLLKPEGVEPEGSRQQPLQRPGAGPVDISQLVEPISDNANLQALALDQVRFPTALPLQVLMAYSNAGAVLDLTDKVDEEGRLDWVAPAGDWTLYAVFQGWHGKMVERAAPGGEGHVIDHFSASAIQTYLQPFDSAFSGYDVSTVRAFFNDSYEVDDARGQADWTPDLFDAFENRRGYDLREHLPALFGHDSEENNSRVRSDYRETISDLLLDTFTEEWRTWAHGKGALVRNQAHGSPANILDLYAASDIPETEGTDLLRIKFASSAANVTGKKLASSESATWLGEHFTSSLADVKRALDRYFLGGINHVVYHGAAYAPQDEPWPGWLFYAAVHFSPANAFWNDLPALNRYVARTQSFLQGGTPDNDVLLYFPIYDRYAAPGDALLEHFDGGGQSFEGSAFKTSAETLQAQGYAFDVISDRQLRRVEMADRRLRTGGVAYQTIVLPESRFIPLETFETLVRLVREGATILVYPSLPGDVPGLDALDARRAAFQQVIDQIRFADTRDAGIREARLGAGRFVRGDDLERLLSYAGVRREALVDDGLHFVRRRHADGAYYFIVNGGEDPVDGWVPLAAAASSVAVFDPMRGTSGFAHVRSSETGGIEAYVQLAPGDAWILATYGTEAQGRSFDYVEAAGASQEIQGVWTVRFVEGGPDLPADVETADLVSWTDFGGEAVQAFSGTARYTITFPKPEGGGEGWLLDLGRVCESAVVRLNGTDLGTLIGPTYRLVLDEDLIQADNVLEVDVSNLMANRIADLDRRQVVWKKFYNVNFPARLPENRDEKGLFDASLWRPRASGLIGPVTLTPVAFTRSR